MPDKTIKVLLVDDDEDDYLLTNDLLKQLVNWNIQLTWCATYQEAVSHLKKANHNLYLFDFLLGEHTGKELLIEANKLNCEEPVILLTGRGDEKTAIETLRLGAADYLIKSELEPRILERSIRYALERTAALKALRHSERRYRQIFEESGDLLFITDTGGLILDANKTAQELTGYNRDQIKLKPISSLLDYKNLDALWAKVCNGVDIQNLEVKLLSARNGKRFCILSASLESHFESTYIQVSLHDITLRKQTERERLFLEKMSVTERLIRMLAHEVRNPLTNVNLSAEQLESELENDDQKFYVEIIKRNCNRINDLITQLLQSSKPTEMPLSPYSLPKLLDETLAMAQDRIKLKKIKVIRKDADKSIIIPLDITSLQLAFLNLINNAIEAMDEDSGVLRIATKVSDSDAEVQISDNGIGISEDIMTKIFEPYFTGKKTGMGIGLASSLSIVHAHHGRIDVQSEEGIGTLFTISFPLNAL